MDKHPQSMQVHTLTSCFALLVVDNLCEEIHVLIVLI